MFILQPMKIVIQHQTHWLHHKHISLSGKLNVRRIYNFITYLTDIAILVTSPAQIINLL